MKTLLGMAILGFATAAAAGPAAPKLEPGRIALDEAAQLSLPSSAGEDAPSVPGLDFVRTGQSTEVSVLNGAMTQQAFTLFQVTAERPGDYSIPIGRTVLKLEVLPAGAATNPSRAQAGAPAPREKSGPIGLLRVVLPKRKLYVGQAVPVTFKADFRAGTEVTLNGLPSLESPAFVVSQLPDKPRQTDEVLGGEEVRAVSWTGTLSAAKPGPASAVATLPLVARYREAVQGSQDPFADLFDDDGDDPFQGTQTMRSMMSRMRSLSAGMFGAVQERELTLRSPPLSVEVLPLPAAGRPPDFSGAVGRFDVRTSIVESAATQYEPLRLRVEISGEGNFERVSTEGISSTADWKAYPIAARPDAQKGASERAGSKSFEQAIAPQRSGLLEVPALRFSYFDPERGAYVSKTTAPISLRVAAAAGVDSPSPELPSAQAATSAKTRATALGAARSDPSALVPPYRHAWFWLLQLAPLALIGAALWRRKSAAPPSPRRQHRELEKQLEERRAQMKRALAERDEAAYFEAARRALQARLGERWGISPEQITAAEVESRPGMRESEATRALAAAERARYGRASLRGSLEEWDSIIGRELDRPGEQR